MTTKIFYIVDTIIIISFIEIVALNNLSDLGLYALENMGKFVMWLCTLIISSILLLLVFLIRYFKNKKTTKKDF